MAASDLISLADFRDYGPYTGTGRLASMAKAISAASRGIESEIGRRIIYRGPIEVPTLDNIVASVAATNVALTIAGQPGAGGRTLIVTISDPTYLITAGTLSVTGTVAGVAGTTVTFDLTAGQSLHGTEFFTNISAASISGLTPGAPAGVTIKVGTSVGYTEYHSPGGNPGSGYATAQTVYGGFSNVVPALYTLEWPIRQVLECNEDPTRAYGTGTKLVEGSDFLVTASDVEVGGYLTRLSGNLPFPWLGGWRSIKLINSAGHRTSVGVPEDVKDVCRRLAKLIFEEVEKGRLGMRGQSDQSGNWQRWAPAGFTDEMREALGPHYRRRYGMDTGVRDWDSEGL